MKRTHRAGAVLVAGVVVLGIGSVAYACGARACCVGSLCVNVEPVVCVNAGGTLPGPVACYANLCTPQAGACCYPDGRCVELLEKLCEADFKGSGTTCDQSPCFAETGACCFVDGSCQITTELGCPGIYQGNDIPCNGQCDLTGACCLANGECEITTEENCEGTYQGDNTHCKNQCELRGACCHGDNPAVCTPDLTEDECASLNGEYQGHNTTCTAGRCGPQRGGISTKGSVLVFSKVELRWDDSGKIKQDTIISLINDYPEDVNVQLYFVNGDPPIDPVFAGNPPVLITEGEPGWNWIDCGFVLTPDQPIYWSAITGQPAGCQPFTLLDPDTGTGPGRPDPVSTSPDSTRILRGFIVAWATDAFGREINWNHLSGKATIVNYLLGSAWEYDAWAFQAREGEHGDLLSSPGVLKFDGIEYDMAFDMLLFDFFASGSLAFSTPDRQVAVNTHLTLHPLSADLRQETEGPITTKAHFDIWNMNERKFSGTERCITCWDQTLLSDYAAPMTFLRTNLQSDKGKARINGLKADRCDFNCIHKLDGIGDFFGLEFVCSQNAALLGVAAKVLTFNGGSSNLDEAGSNLVGMGFESAKIRYDIVSPPGQLAYPPDRGLRLDVDRAEKVPER